MGRPTKITPKRIERLLTALKAGNSRKASCIHAGFSYDALNDKLKLDDKLRDKVEEAEFFAEMRHVGTIERATRPSKDKEGNEKPGDWRASAWWLSHRRRKDWSDKAYNEAPVPIGNTGTAIPETDKVQASALSKYTIDELENLRTILLGANARRGGNGASDQEPPPLHPPDVPGDQPGD